MKFPKYEVVEFTSQIKYSNATKSFDENPKNSSKVKLNKTQPKKAKKRVKSKNKKRKSKRKRNMKKFKQIKPNVEIKSTTARIEYNNGYPVLEGMSIKGSKMKKGSFKKRFNGENHGFYLNL